MKLIIILITLLSLVLIAGCCNNNDVIYSGTVESVYGSSIAISGKFFESICPFTLKDISKGDQVNIYCSSRIGCKYAISKITPEFKYHKYQYIIT